MVVENGQLRAEVLTCLHRGIQVLSRVHRSVVPYSSVGEVRTVSEEMSSRLLHQRWQLRAKEFAIVVVGRGRRSPANAALADANVRVGRKREDYS